MFVKYFTIAVISINLSSLGQTSRAQEVAQTITYQEKKPKKSGVTFKNQIKEDENHNILTYEYFYNGGGVAAGDIDNDGLDDIFLTGNMVENALYHNQGDFKFKDISKKAGIKGKGGWTTGVTMADINADGHLDIYVCYSGDGDTESRKNELYINNGDLSFSESAAKYGLDASSNSTQALFFDFDKDGDLDMFLLNHNIEVIHELEFAAAKTDRHPTAGDRLYRNDNGTFTDISEAAGIIGNALGFGLGIISSDINEDGWPDLYISNDYVEHDYLYINNQDGTFSEKLVEKLQHISHFSMGLDIADINNDGMKDIFTLDMLPEDNKRQKLLYGPENYEHYGLMLAEGFHHQNMRNMLQVNNGNDTFSEIGQLAGISNTDWSWSSLFFDANNDGYKDLYVTNGYYRDYTNRDFLKYKGDYYFQKAINREKADTLELVTSMTSTPIPNYAFQNNGDLTFRDVSEQWNLAKRGFSNGAAYTDLDNDGLLDLVVNNLNDFASVYQNTSTSGTKGNFLKVTLKGEAGNTFGIGSQVTLYANNRTLMLEQMPTRGFQSSISYTLHFGLGTIEKVDSLRVIWPSGKTQLLQGISPDQTIALDESQASALESTDNPRVQTAYYQLAPSPVQYDHKEKGYNDFKRQPLLTEMPSHLGPKLASTTTSDGSILLYIGGTKGNPGRLFKTDTSGGLSPTTDILPSDEFTDADAIFLDANQDGHPDLYVASGGYHNYTANDEALQDRLYLNDGTGKLIKNKEALPAMLTSTAVVRSADINQDGFPDLFVGGRIVPGKYPETPESYLLMNDGTGKYKEATTALAPDLRNVGMVTDATWTDINGDHFSDLIIVGECLPFQVYINQNGQQLVNQTSLWLPESPHGLWSSLAKGDFDGDGDDDLILGNYGLNSQLKASKEQPMTLYYGDFDKNGSVDPLMVRYVQGEAYPFASRDELLDQLYGMRSKFTDYETYSQAKIEDILTQEQLDTAEKLTVNELRTLYLENTGNAFSVHSLPIEAQFAPVYSIEVMDFDDDGTLDVILGGNQTHTRLRIGVMDANFGQVFLGDGNGHFSYIPQNKSGLAIKGDIKSILPLTLPQGQFLLFGLNNQGVIAYKKVK
ncbi:RNA-binding protein [Echinicola soli]|uniref:RNA-binding protein n=1 Tax=Echinicola soli TaxID=2591634 RepID=A0A514CM60_9BACT|nr:VCBS repeat-containing protein [Echinicola soli]QDH80888.1 RNA-binding protein [Echinicola soli]